ncbi:SusD/RagB family nutrient-binding outer membrane lipoprotein [Pedobacter sp. ASV1-7]|uniref:SusD/RagB family nutrient-binding outer membrane lipoprotein n=1 Tax=Pedobacter sp. ASV1-7 TaxID=3145237 RepID=UPI0032E8E3DD
MDQFTTRLAIYDLAGNIVYPVKSLELVLPGDTQVGEERIAGGKPEPHINNMIQVARIWRAYLLSEMSDNFGSIPIKGFQGVNPDFTDVKTVYYYILAELTDAASKLYVSVTRSDALKKLDPAYEYDFAKWRKYANSMRLRYAMRLSEVDSAYQEI